MQIFGRIMSYIPNTPLVLTPLEIIEWAVINPRIGLRVNHNASGVLAVPFIRGSAPAVPDPDADVEPSIPAVPGPGKQPVQKKKPRYLIDWLKDVFK